MSDDSKPSTIEEALSPLQTSLIPRIARITEVSKQKTLSDDTGAQSTVAEAHANPHNAYNARHWFHVAEFFLPARSALRREMRMSACFACHSPSESPLSSLVLRCAKSVASRCGAVYARDDVPAPVARRCT